MAEDWHEEIMRLQSDRDMHINKTNMICGCVCKLGKWCALLYLVHYFQTIPFSIHGIQLDLAFLENPRFPYKTLVYTQ